MQEVSGSIPLGSTTRENCRTVRYRTSDLRLAQATQSA